MKVERQGHNECALATLAALAGARLEEVRFVACAAAGWDEWTLVRNVPGWRAFLRGLRAAANYANRPGLFDHILAATPTVLPRLGLPAPAGVRILGPRTRVLPARGRGTIVTRLGSGRRLLRHIAPWEDGLVHNTNGSAPLTLADYRRRTGWRVEIITVE